MFNVAHYGLDVGPPESDFELPSYRNGRDLASLAGLEGHGTPKFRSFFGKYYRHITLLLYPNFTMGHPSVSANRGQNPMFFSHGVTRLSHGTLNRGTMSWDLSPTIWYMIWVCPKIMDLLHDRGNLNGQNFDKPSKLCRYPDPASFLSQTICSMCDIYIIYKQM
jgi:hypothetical protein